MRLLVQDFLKSANLHELDTDTGVVAPAAGRDRAQARGYFAKLGRTPVVFYAHAGGLHLRAGDEDVPLAGSKVDLAGEGLRTLRVEKGGDVVLRLQYPNPVNPPREFDLSMAEEEDFDLGLFVKNVLHSSMRQRRMLEKWSS